MQDYPLESLGPEGFERLIQTILHVVIGHGTIIFASGADGSREATFTGNAPYPSETDRWDGSWVFQAKFHNIMKTGPANARKAVLEELESELNKVVQKYQDRCNNYIFATNVVLTPVFEKGTLDRIYNEIIPKFSPQKIKNIHVWGYDQICRYLDGHADIRDAFGLFTPGDLIKRLETKDIAPVNNLSDLHNYYNIEHNRIVKINETALLEIKNEIKKWSITPLSSRKSLFLVTGNPGIGKSWTTYNVIADLMKEGYLVYAITGTAASKHILVDSEDIKKRIPNTVFILDDHNISLDNIETSMEMSDVASLIKTIIPDRLPKYTAGPIIISIRDDTWNQILQNRFDSNTLSKFVSKVTLLPLTIDDTRLVVRSFYSTWNNITPKYPSISVSSDLESKIIEKSKGNPIVVELFFVDVGSGLNGASYVLKQSDVNNIIDDAKFYALKLIFQYYLSELSDEEITTVIGFLYYLVIKRPISIGHVMYILSQNDFLKLALTKKGNLFKEKPLHLFNLNQYGIISPFHDIISDAIVKLVHNPDKLLAELDSDNEYLHHNIKRIVDLDIIVPLKNKASEVFLDKYHEYANKSLLYYVDTLCQREITKTEKINDETMFMTLSIFAEYLSHRDTAEYEPQIIQKLILLLANNEVNFQNYKSKIESQLLIIFEKLGLFIRPVPNLKKHYLQLSSSDNEQIKFSAWSYIPSLLRNNIVTKDEVISIKAHLLSLLTSNNIRIMNGSWIIVQNLLRYKVIDHNDQEIILTLLKNENKSIRWNAWKNASYFVIWGIITVEELSEIKEVYLNLLMDPSIGMDAWMNVHRLVEDNVIKIEDLKDIKSSFILNLGDINLGYKLLFIWPAVLLLYKNNILDEGDKKNILRHLDNESFELRTVAWINICKILDEDLLNGDDVWPFRSSFLGLFQYYEYNAELWNCMRVLIQKGVFTINEFLTQLQNTQKLIDNAEDPIKLNLLLCLIQILSVDSSGIITPKRIKEIALELTKASDPLIQMTACNILINLPVPEVIKPKEIIEVKKKIFNFAKDTDEIKRMNAWGIISHMVKNGLISDHGIIKTREIIEIKDSLFSLLSSSSEQVIFGAWSVIMFLTLSDIIEFSEVESRKESLFSLLDISNEIGVFAKAMVEGYFNLAEQRRTT